MIFYIAVMLTVFLFLALLLAPAILRPSPAARRMLEMVKSGRPDERSIGGKERVQGKILSMAQGLRSRLGLTEDAKLKQQLLSAGLTSSRSMNGTGFSGLSTTWRVAVVMYSPCHSELLCRL